SAVLTDSNLVTSGAVAPAVSAFRAVNRPTPWPSRRATSRARERKRRPGRSPPRRRNPSPAARMRAVGLPRPTPQAREEAPGFEDKRGCFMGSTHLEGKGPRLAPKPKARGPGSMEVEGEELVPTSKRKGRIKHGNPALSLGGASRTTHLGQGRRSAGFPRG